jgi:ribonuclease R
VRLVETGADGFVPASSIGREYFYHDEARHVLVGEDTGLAYRLGDPVEVRLVEAIPTAGALRFEMLSEGRTVGTRPKGAPRRNDKGKPQRYKGKGQRQDRASPRKRR